MESTPRLPRGFQIGHWEDTGAVTGCTVILAPQGTVGGCDVRGGSPGTRETALLASEKSMQTVHALLLTGGSAYGLAAADGIMRFLEERGIGYETPWGKVPIVPAAVIFDLNIGSPSVRPDSSSGYQACLAARSENLIQGSVGAGLGATVGKWSGGEGRMKGGLGIAFATEGEITVSAVAVVNAMGDILDGEGRILAGARTADGGWAGESARRRFIRRAPGAEVRSTTLVAILTDARLSKVDANRIAQRAHDGLARAISPVHTSLDGDTVFCLASCQMNGSPDLVAELGVEATAESIRNAVRHAKPVAGVPALHT